MRFAALCACLIAFFLSQCERPAKAAEEAPIRLLVRGDDIGSSHAANLACIQSCREGIARSLEVMVPCAWFEEAAVMLNDNPNIDVGVHLTLTSEWTGLKWRPLTHAPSLVDEDGYFHPRTGDFAAGNPKREEVEQELRSQIELARKKIKNVTHLSSHMGAPTCRPELKELVDSLANEYGLAVDMSGVKPFRSMGSSKDPFEKRLAMFLESLENFGPGTWLLVEHPGLDTPEMQAHGHPGYENVAQHRRDVTRLFTDPKVKEVIQRRSIELVSYGQLKDSNPKRERVQ
ncbi:MAG: ChbG/HpnK family deacetylase [Planctomycetaceae bacterium]|nr:ChbG/HpnK family deacetylase [Planctomycetaceae bacterium]